MTSLRALVPPAGWFQQPHLDVTSARTCSFAWNSLALVYIVSIFSFIFPFAFLLSSASLSRPASQTTSTCSTPGFFFLMSHVTDAFFLSIFSPKSDFFVFAFKDFSCFLERFVSVYTAHKGHTTSGVDLTWQTIPFQVGASSNKLSHYARKKKKHFFSEGLNAAFQWLSESRKIEMNGSNMDIIWLFPRMFCVLFLCDTCLGWHDLGVGAVDFDSCIETGLVMALNHVSTVCILSSHTAVIRPWKSMTWRKKEELG